MEIVAHEEKRRRGGDDKRKMQAPARGNKSRGHRGVDLKCYQLNRTGEVELDPY